MHLFAEVSFVVLFVVSVINVLGSVRALFKGRDLSKFKFGFGVYVWLTLVAAMSVVVVAHSNLGAVKYVILALMLVSIGLDLKYMRTISRLKAAGALWRVPERKWWSVVDNALWIAALAVLYLA